MRALAAVLLALLAPACHSSQPAQTPHTASDYLAPEEEAFDPSEAGEWPQQSARHRRIRERDAAKPAEPPPVRKATESFQKKVEVGDTVGNFWKMTVTFHIELPEWVKHKLEDNPTYRQAVQERFEKRVEEITAEVQRWAVDWRQEWQQSYGGGDAQRPLERIQQWYILQLNDAALAEFIAEVPLDGAKTSLQSVEEPVPARTVRPMHDTGLVQTAQASLKATGAKPVQQEKSAQFKPGELIVTGVTVFPLKPEFADNR